jgi:hypothetical protein
MDCRELTNDLLADHSGWRLAPEEQRLVAGHLEGCVACRARRDELEVMAEAIRATRPVPPARLLEEIDRAVLASLPRRPALPSQRRPRLWPYAAAAALLLGITGALAISLFRPPETRPVVAAPSQPAAVEALPAPLPQPQPKPLPGPIEDPKPKPEPEVPKPAPKPPPEEAPKPAPKPEPEAPQPPPKPPPEAPKPAPEPPKPAPPPPPPPPRAIVLGDLNEDGVVDIADARKIQQALVQGLPLPPEADVNGDGAVDVADVRQITRAEVAAR